MGMREEAAGAARQVLTEIADERGPGQINPRFLPSTTRVHTDQGRPYRLASIWFPAGHNRGMHVDDYGDYVRVEGWAHDAADIGAASRVEVSVPGIPSIETLRWVARSVGLLLPIADSRRPEFGGDARVLVCSPPGAGKARG
jgi:hypothetical protein